MDLSIRMPNPSPTLDKNLASMGAGILSSIGVGVWRRAPEEFPGSNTTLDTFQSAMKEQPASSNCRELRNLYHRHPESKKIISSERISGAIDPCGGYGNAGKSQQTISTMAILWPVKARESRRGPLWWR